MRLTRHRRHTVVASAVLGAVVMGMLVGEAAPGAASTPPASAAELEAALAAAEGTAAAASTRALQAQATAELARAAADAARARSAGLSALGAEADVALAAHTTQLGAAAAGWYRATSEAPLLAQVLTSADPETLLSRLSTMERVASVSALLAGAAREMADTTAAQHDQAALAQVEYERLAAAADAASASAQKEVETEAAAVTRSREELDALYARLAALKRTTVAQEKTERLESRVEEQVAAQPGAGTAAPPVSPPAAVSPPAPPAAAPAPPSPVAPAPPPSSGTVIATPTQAQAQARSLLAARGWGDTQFSCLQRLWNRESGWRVEARNPSSGAYGIPQAYPAEKMAAAGPDWRTNATTQISWGLSYISARYGTPCGAWDHSERTGWY